MVNELLSNVSNTGIKVLSVGEEIGPVPAYYFGREQFPLPLVLKNFSTQRRRYRRIGMIPRTINLRIPIPMRWQEV